ncbi:EthD domain-containing protein [Fusarium flagelliforme]|uniref:EthD domain-containing protein n=1 Tax=Fusarium flagelliforme TaxID=2675880 RepID=A0A395N2Q7_9HYPO|nr:EthD domain-containing protein [Fusarium flagelliforme]KAH7174813.1 EthD domain-containing protein [Fusarium flagelliforme]RFN54394.1 hypothetical protein FIE12Z_1521 [Fusarium flagelliforme]
MVQITSLLLTVGLVGTALASSSKTGLLQMLTYVKRHPNMTRDEFYEYWDTQHAPKVAPLATAFGITRYQQVRVAGKIVPTDAGAEAPVSNQLVDFDGVALFLYESADDLLAMLAHPYYIEVVEPDEHVFIDKSAHGNGQVATYIGEHIDVVDNEKTVWVGDKKTKKKYEKLFKSYQ